MSDHREIGASLNLFIFDSLSPGIPIWLPKGMILYNILLDRIKKLNEQNGYLEVRTPLIWKSDLYKISGHLEHYASNMYSVQDGYNLKPMNCPGHMQIFKSKQWSYRDLPFGLAEYSPLHRNEISGAIGGLTRCRAFCQDDAHIFCNNDNLELEINKILKMIHTVYSEWFGMKYNICLSTRPNNYMGELEDWNKAESVLTGCLSSNKLNFSVNSGDGAFYGPKIDFSIIDNLNRIWQTATIQLDFQLPNRFDLNYIDQNGDKRTPIVIHRAIYGSFERFIGILLEHFNGELPVWLSPISFKILPISEKVHEYSLSLYKQINSLCRAEIDLSNNTLGNKILHVHNNKIPFSLIIGEKEASSKKVAVRKLDKTQQVLDYDECIKFIKKEVNY